MFFLHLKNLLQVRFSSIFWLFQHLSHLVKDPLIQAGHILKRKSECRNFKPLYGNDFWRNSLPTHKLYNNIIFICIRDLVEPVRDNSEAFLGFFRDLVNRHLRVLIVCKHKFYLSEVETGCVAQSNGSFKPNFKTWIITLIQ